MAISLQRVIRSTSCLVLWYGFRGRRIERRYLRFEQIQDGGHRHVGKISSGDISATGRPIHFMFCSRVGFLGRRIYWRHFQFEQIQDGGHRHVGKISSGDISATGLPIHFMFCCRVGFSGTADLMALFSIRTKMAAAAILDNFEWPNLHNGSRSTYIARIARSSLR